VCVFTTTKTTSAPTRTTSNTTRSMLAESDRLGLTHLPRWASTNTEPDCADVSRSFFMFCLGLKFEQERMMSCKKRRRILRIGPPKCNQRPSRIQPGCALANSLQMPTLRQTSADFRCFANASRLRVDKQNLLADS